MQLRSAAGVCTTAVVAGLALASLSAHDPINAKVTWNTDVARLVQARCVRCHTPGGRGPMPLTTYEEARPWARAIREAVLTRRMPKWHAARGYGQFANDPSLSPFEIALVVSWVDAGAPRGPQPAAGAAEAATRAAESPAPGGTRTLSVPCGDEPLPAGRLVAITPRLDLGASAGITVVLPDGRREIVAWIRNFDTRFTDTYWLRRPIALTRGARLAVDASGRCSVGVTLGSLER
jgi:hypothetical protein